MTNSLCDLRHTAWITHDLSSKNCQFTSHIAYGNARLQRKTSRPPQRNTVKVSYPSCYFYWSFLFLEKYIIAECSKKYVIKINEDHFPCQYFSACLLTFQMNSSKCAAKEPARFSTWPTQYSLNISMDARNTCISFKDEMYCFPPWPLQTAFAFSFSFVNAAQKDICCHICRNNPLLTNPLKYTVLCFLIVPVMKAAYVQSLPWGNSLLNLAVVKG